MKRELPDPSSSSSGTKGKMWGEEPGGCSGGGGGMDESLAVLGYKVRSGDMVDVAKKLEEIEKIMISRQQRGGLSDMVTDSVHYNPAELSSWLESILTDFNPPPSSSDGAPPPFFGSSSSSSIIFDDSSDYDLKVIPGKAIYPPQPQPQPQPTTMTAMNQIQFSSGGLNTGLNPNSPTNQHKRMKPSTASNSEPSYMSSSTSPMSMTYSTESSRPVVMVDSQENGVRLVHALLACADAVQKSNLTVAEALVKQIGFLAISQAGAMRKVATYFAEALARRIYNLYPPENPLDHSLSDVLQLHFYESCPYLKFAHFTANQAILEAFEGKSRVHVVDFSMNQGVQWPVLMQALAIRPEGPPVFRLTAIGPPAADDSDYLQEVGWKLAKIAETLHIKFEYRGFVANSLIDLDASIIGLGPSQTEAVAVNSIFELHKLLARPGGIEKVLGVIRQMKPVIVTVVEQEANLNGPVFLDRFTESLHYYSTLFDSLEGSESDSGNQQDKVMSEVYLGKQICNVVACDGLDRVERHETLAQWRTRFGSAGFEPVHLGSNAYKQASMLLQLFTGGDGYVVEENSGSLMLGWHTRPLIATSAWKPVVTH